MSEEVDPPPAQTLAAEHALGVLTGPERAMAEARMSRDATFAAEVDAWRERLAPLLDEIEEAPPGPELWSRIERLLPDNDELEALRGRARFWRSAATGSLAVAAASLAAAIIVANKPPVVVRVPVAAPAPAPAPLLNASLATASGRPMLVAAYDPARKVLLITSLARPGRDPRHVHQLWIVPADGKPHSLGLVEPGASKSMPMPDDMVPMMTEGGMLMISVEPPGGSRNKGAPSGPMAAKGKLLKI